MEYMNEERRTLQIPHKVTNRSDFIILRAHIKGSKPGHELADRTETAYTTSAKMPSADR